MASKPEPDPNRLTSIARLVGGKGVVLHERGGLFEGRCPFHKGRKPPLTVDAAGNTWRCPRCSPKPSTVVEWVMRAEGLSRRHAVELLRADTPSFEPSPRAARQKGPTPRHTTRRAPDSTFDGVGGDDDLLSRVVSYYHQRLKGHAEALAYLDGRGIRGAELLEHLRLGVADRSLCYKLPLKNRRLGAELRGRLERLGVLRATGHEHLRGSIVVPLFDAEGRVVNVYGRKIGARLRRGTPLGTWLNDDRRGVVNRPCLAGAGTVIVTASILDALSCWTHGQRAVTAIHGLDGPTSDLLHALQAEHVRRIVLAFPRTADGKAGAETLAATLAGAGVEVLRAVLPSGMDVNDLVRASPDPTAALGQVLRSAQWLAGSPSAKTTATATVLSTAPEAPTADGIAAPSVATSTASDDPPRVEPAPVERAPAMGSRAAQKGTGPDDLTLTYGSRTWRVRGIARNAGFESLKVNLMVAAPSGDFHVDVVELYSARHRSVFVQMAAAETGVSEVTLKKDLGQLLLHVERLQDERLARGAEPTRTVPAMTPADEERAMELLRAPDLMGRIVGDFHRLGIVGEGTNKLVGYLAAVSRKTSHPLAVLIQSSSSAGKSTLMDAILGFVPEEERVLYSAMTGQSLFYVGDGDLRHKVLAIVEEQGARRASYALKLLQSEGALTIASTGKDPTTGRLVSQEYRVEGPVMLLLTTTAIDVDDELLGRCLVLTVDESPAQTRAIHDRQRRSQSVEGLLAHDERDRIVRLHHNAQRLLRPRPVVNPFASSLDFGDYRVRARRDHRKLLGLIETVALLHQYQRPIRVLEHDGRSVECIEASTGDVATAQRLFREIVGERIDDLPPQTSKLLALLGGMVTVGSRRLGIERTEYRFTRRQLRDELGWGNTASKRHLARLVDAEFVIAHGSQHGRGLVYELAYAPEVEAANEGEREAATGYDDERSHHGHGPVTPWSRGGQGAADGPTPRGSQSFASSEARSAENARRGSDDERGAVVVPASAGAATEEPT